MHNHNQNHNRHKSELKINDPVKKQEEVNLDEMKGATPYDPPGVYDENKKIVVAYEDLSEILQHLTDEHKELVLVIEKFEKELIGFKSNGFHLTKEINQGFSEFFNFYDNHLLLHNEKEDKILFPLLNEKLIASGEHSTGENPMTAIDIMEDDHIKFIQLGTLAFNFFGLASRIRDEEARTFVCDSGYNAARELLELLRLHIYREDYTLFPLANKLISKDEFAAMEKGLKKYATPVHSCETC